MNIWKWVSRVLDDVELVILMLVFLVAAYCVYDAACIYEGATDRSLMAYSPGARSENESKSLPGSVAWLEIPDTGIQDPVMQGTDNNQYLNTDPYGDYSLSGSIFLDAANAADFSDSYSLIYGHHMELGRMFGALDRFLKKEFFMSCKEGVLTVESVTYDIRFFSVLQIDAGSEMLFSVTKNANPERIEWIKAHCLYFRDIPSSDRLLALSTCVDAGSTLRTVLVGYLFERSDTHDKTESRGAGSGTTTTSFVCDPFGDRSLRESGCDSVDSCGV